MKFLKNTTLTLVSNFIPAMLAIPTLGFLARSLGVEMFGIYTIAIAIVGYAGIFDAGLTKSIVREIAINRNNEEVIYKVIACGTLAIFILGVIACLIMLNFAPLLINLLNISSIHAKESCDSLKILALSIPISLLNQSWMAIHEGQERFLILSVQRTLGSVFVSILPVLFVIYVPTLNSAIFGLLVSRIITVIISFVFSKSEIINAGVAFEFATFKRLFKFGGWLTISNIISPIMSYFDRFIISHLMGAGNVSFYTSPAELVNKGLLVPNALSRAIFPNLVSEQDSTRRKAITKAAYKWTIIVCGSGSVIGFFIADWFMVLWMGSAFHGEPVTVLRILLIGFLFVSISQIPFNIIQSSGKSNWTATLHMIELFPYLAVLYFLINMYGVVGAAMAWSIRLVIEFFILKKLAKEFL